MGWLYNKLAKPDDTPLSYRIDFTIEPRWEEILARLTKQNNQVPGTFYKSIVGNKKLKIKKGEGLWSKEFYFKYFYDAVSGMGQIWSDNAKTFVPSLEVRGHVFAEEYGSYPLRLREKYEDKDISRQFVITPGSIGVLEDSMFDAVDNWSEIPIYEIIHVLKETHRFAPWLPMYRVKAFPPDVKKEMIKHKVKYGDDTFIHDPAGEGLSDVVVKSVALKKIGLKLYDQRMELHCLRAPYLVTYFRIEVFEAPTR